MFDKSKPEINICDVKEIKFPVETVRDRINGQYDCMISGFENIIIKENEVLVTLITTDENDQPLLSVIARAKLQEIGSLNELQKQITEQQWPKFFIAYENQHVNSFIIHITKYGYGSLSSAYLWMRKNEIVVPIRISTVLNITFKSININHENNRPTSDIAGLGEKSKMVSNCSNILDKKEMNSCNFKRRETIIEELAAEPDEKQESDKLNVKDDAVAGPSKPNENKKDSSFFAAARKLEETIHATLNNNNLTGIDDDDDVFIVEEKDSDKIKEKKSDNRFLPQDLLEQQLKTFSSSYSKPFPTRSFKKHSSKHYYYVDKKQKLTQGTNFETQSTPASSQNQNKTNEESEDYSNYSQRAQSNFIKKLQECGASLDTWPLVDPNPSFVEGPYFYIEGIIRVHSELYFKKKPLSRDINTIVSRLVRSVLLPSYKISQACFNGKSKIYGDLFFIIFDKLNLTFPDDEFGEVKRAAKRVYQDALIEHAVRLEGNKEFDQSKYNIVFKLFSKHIADFCYHFKVGNSRKW